MYNIWRIFIVSLKGNYKFFLLGLLLSFLVLLAGFALLGVSGWFITATGIAGLAGIGIGFDVFRPSAAIRFLALGRTAARYGERVLTHEATLKALAKIRVDLLDKLLQKPFIKLQKVRGSEVLNRLTADVDALDGIMLRLFLPLLAALGFYLSTTAFMWWLTTAQIAFTLLAIHLVGAGLGLYYSYKAAYSPSARMEQSNQQYRRALLELQDAKVELTIAGVLQQRLQEVDAIAKRLEHAQANAANVERKAGVILGFTSMLGSATTLYLAVSAAKAGIISPALAAFAFFASLALSEALGPLRKGMAALGRIHYSAKRVGTLMQADKETPAISNGVKAPAQCKVITPNTESDAQLPMLRLENVHYALPAPAGCPGGGSTTVIDDFSMRVNRGQSVALTGLSGAGKSTILHLCAGLLAPTSGKIYLKDTSLDGLSSSQRTDSIGYLPQRSHIICGSVRESLVFGNTKIADSQLWQAIESVQLHNVLHKLGGLDAKLEESAKNLSGGEKRRFCLARVIVRNTSILLLDEPTEGLDRDTATKVLEGIGNALPDAAIVMASHRAAEAEWCDLRIRMI
ncbi:amino acid ABC transporter ATP-binding/permease protein [Polycladidibacter stylochi]|uniref:amino acid ABC transporter ATP-binding/permease protein n=1 Tax=Polycladidibacter stylochi TaxID=1807766 RepID=UPI000835D242|nr:ATP-binding cassette domain-containing protein [Pseudovibrio stylochi]